MHLVGIGFTADYWQTMIDSVRKQVSSETMVGTLLSTEAVTSEETGKLKNLVIDSRPDLVLFNLHALDNPRDWPKFLNDTQKNCEPGLRWALVVENIIEELSAMFRLGPEVELVNQMRFPVADPSMLLTRHIRRFPRIPLTAEVRAFEYQDCTHGTVRSTLEDIPRNTLISLKDIKEVETVEGDRAPGDWLDSFLAFQTKPVQSEQVKGILREEKGCYLFPGIPFNSIGRIFFRDAAIGHVLRSGGFTLRNPPFKRMIEAIREERMNTARFSPKTLKARQHIPIRSISSFPVLNALMRMLLSELGYRNFSETTRLDSGMHVLEKGVIYLQLTEFGGAVLRGKFLDWSEDIRKCIIPLLRFVDLRELEMTDAITSTPLLHLDLERMSLDMLRREKQYESGRNLARNRDLFFSQELADLGKAAKAARALLPALAGCRDLPDFGENAEQIDADSVLLLCEEEDQAAQIMFQLKNISRKLWLNPQDFTTPESLRTLNPSTLRNFTRNGATIAGHSACEHLKTMCMEAIRQIEKTGAAHRQQLQLIEESENQLRQIRVRKTQLALHWLYVSLKQLLVRDLHRFPAGTL